MLIYVPGAEELTKTLDLWPGTDMAALLVWKRPRDILPALALPDAVHVQSLMVVPLFAGERAYKVQHGADALWQAWAKTPTPYWEPRSSQQIMPEPDDGAGTAG